MKICIHCGEDKCLDQYHNNKGVKGGKLSVCKCCRKIEQQNYRKDGRGKLRDKKYRDSGKGEINNSKYCDNHPIRKYCQSSLSNALRDGKIIKPTSCESCGLSDRIQGHHWLYSEAAKLDVFWLCKSCHTKEHEFISRLGYPTQREFISYQEVRRVMGYCVNHVVLNKDGIKNGYLWKIK